jgi:type IV secretory pathway TrbD component
MSSLVHITQTVTSTARHLLKGDDRYTRILTGVMVLVYIYILRSAIAVALNLTFLLLKTILLYAVSKPYMVVGSVLLKLSTDTRLGARTRAMIVAASVLCTYISNPNAHNMDVGKLSPYTSEATRVLNMGHERLTGDLFAHSFETGLQLPSSIDVLKCVCLSVLVVAALKQSNTNPKPTMLEALLS